MAKGQADTSTASSADLEQMIAEETSRLAESLPAKEETEGAETTEETEEAAEEEVTEAETSQEEQEEEEQPAEEPSPKRKRKEPGEQLIRLKVQGKERDYTLAQVIAKAQQEEDYSIKMERLNKEKQELEQMRQQLTQAQQLQGQPDPRKIHEWSVGIAQENFPLAVNYIIQAHEQQKEQQTRMDRMADREFEVERASDPLWDAIKPLYREYRDDGKPRDVAYLAARGDILERALKQSSKISLKEGERKARAKAKAALPAGERKGASEGLPSLEQARKMTAAQLEKFFKITKND